MKKILYITVIIFILVIGAALHYYLPHTKKAFLVGTEVKRVDSKLKKDQTRDLRFIIAREQETGDTLVFRNEDMGWPPHVKFDSATLSGKAMNWINSKPDTLVLVKYYGWRVPLFSMFPNITSIKQIDENYSHIPWFNIIFFSLLIILALYIRMVLRARKMAQSK